MSGLPPFSMAMEVVSGAGLETAGPVRPPTTYQPRLCLSEPRSLLSFPEPVEVPRTPLSTQALRSRLKRPYRWTGARKLPSEEHTLAEATQSTVTHWIDQATTQPWLEKKPSTPYIQPPTKKNKLTSADMAHMVRQTHSRVYRRAPPMRAKSIKIRRQPKEDEEPLSPVSDEFEDSYDGHHDRPVSPGLLWQAHMEEEQQLEQLTRKQDTAAVLNTIPPAERAAVQDFMGKYEQTTSKQRTVGNKQS